MRRSKPIAIAGNALKFTPQTPSPAAANPIKSDRIKLETGRADASIRKCAEPAGRYTKPFLFFFSFLFFLARHLGMNRRFLGPSTTIVLQRITNRKYKTACIRGTERDQCQKLKFPVKILQLDSIKRALLDTAHRGKQQE